jgi:hypothetical protein
LFGRVIVNRKAELPRGWEDYEVQTDSANLPNGIAIEQRL